MFQETKIRFEIVKTANYILEAKKLNVEKQGLGLCLAYIAIAQ